MYKSFVDLPVSTSRQLASGPLLLYDEGFFPWGAFPYPKAHAELGVALSKQEVNRPICLKMAEFQLATLDHKKKTSLLFLSTRARVFF